MSLHIGKWIKGWRLDRFFKDLFHGDNNAELKDITAKAVVLVEKIKEYASSPNADMVTAIIPGDWDDALKEKVKAVIPKVLEQVAKGSECFDQPSLGEKVACIVRNTTSNPDAGERTKFFHELAGAFGVALSDGKFTLSDLFLILEPVYRLFKKKG